jgi:hypothetical protein
MADTAAPSPPRGGPVDLEDGPAAASPHSRSALEAVLAPFADHTAPFLQMPGS